MEYSPKTIGPYGCVVFIASGMLVGFSALVYIATHELKPAQQENWWLLGLILIPILYILIGGYIHVRPYLTHYSSRKWFILGRILSFFVYPCFAYLIGWLVWHLSKTIATASILGLSGGWLITKVLQKTLFSSESVR